LRRVLLPLLACILSAAAAAAPLPADAKKEVDALLSRLESSACAFNRNGIWHTAPEARAHLLRKLKHLEDKGAAQSAEQFIELVASSSSTTGQPYLVRCGNETAVQSGTWLRARLQAMRSSER
jgi:hypothetical protein